MNFDDRPTFEAIIDLLEGFFDGAAQSRPNSKLSGEDRPD
jgi:hypothetical protein